MRTHWALPVLLVALVGCGSAATPAPGSTTKGGATTSSTTGTEPTVETSTDRPGATEPVSSSTGGAPATESTAPGPQTPTGPELQGPDPQVQDLVTGLAAPWSVAPVEGVALVSERDSGRILEVDPSTGALREVTTVPDVRHGGEGGLLGLVVHDGEVFLYATTDDGNRVQRAALTGVPGSFTLGTPETILDGIPAGRTHNGGRLAIGPDGLLYVSTGDAGNRDAAQDPASLAGKILRIAPDGAIPADNPFPGSPVYSLGHRNVQGLGWSADGTFYAAEFGQSTWDELNVVVPGGNYGWPEVEGAADREGFVDPIRQWSTDEASPSGIAVLDGQVVVANLRGRSVRVVVPDDPDADRVLLDGTLGRVRDVVVVGSELWALTNNTDGRGDPRDGDDRLVRIG